MDNALFKRQKTQKSVITTIRNSAETSKGMTPDPFPVKCPIFPRVNKNPNIELMDFLTPIRIS